MSVGQQNEIIYGTGFLTDVRKLPHEAQRKLSKLLVLIPHDLFDPYLHTKPLSPPLQGNFTFRIMRDWRVAFDLHQPHVVRLLIADNRKNIYQRLRRMLGV